MAAAYYSRSVGVRLSRRIPSTFWKRFCAQACIEHGVVLGVYQTPESSTESKLAFTDDAQKFNDHTSGRLQEIIRISGHKGELGKCKTYFGLDKDYPCVAVVGLGKRSLLIDTETTEEKESSGNVRHAASVGARALRDAGVENVWMDSFNDSQASSEGANLGLFTFDSLKSPKKRKLKVNLGLYKNTDVDAKGHWEDGTILADSQNFARTLMETPANLMTPKIFTDAVSKQLSESVENLEIYSRDEDWAREHKMGAFLCVGQGSVEPSRLLEVRYFGADKKGAAPLVLVGKGVTFDSGGISIKPSQQMSLMKGDMGGAATVAGALDAILKLRLPINVVALMPLCENLPSGSAVKPGDVVTAMNGKTIEVDNTDAEGRLILADALCYANSFKPLALVNFATLTGAIDIALGQVATGVFSNSPTLWHHIFQAGFSSGERMWRMPLYRHYSKQIESDVADVRNIGKPDRSAGSCTAAAFLKEFVDTRHWAHFDIAGVMSNSSKAVPYLGPGMTGRPTRAIVELARRLLIHKLE